MIKPIETEYDGHRFRSRLEARWAVFFNEMGWKYHYELDDIMVEHKGEILRYLPDFYVIIKGGQTYSRSFDKDDHKAFIEVKGPRMTEVDEIKVLGAGKHFAEAGLGEVIYVFQAIPTVQELEDNNGKMCVDMAYGDKFEPTYLCHDGVPAACDKARKARFEHGEKG